MLTCKQTVVKTINRLTISCDEDVESPREWSNIGYFLTKDTRHQSPDGTKIPLYRIMVEQGDKAKDQSDHMARIKREAKKEGINVKAIYPVVKYEHGDVVYRLGEAHGFDYSNNGFYIITDESAKEVGTKPKDWKKQVEEELKTYTQWCNGEVYYFVLYDEDGEMVDSCGGFYNIDDIKEHLPEEWKGEDLEEYFNA